MIIVNDKIFNSEEFHNGEVIFKIPEAVNKRANIIEMIFENNKDITSLLFVKTWLDKEVGKNVPCYLIMKYCPYSRMDRQINDQMFSMDIFATIINNMNFKEVYILDPHSTVCVELLDRVKLIRLADYIDKVVSDFNPDYICYPDKGAFNKYPKLLRHLNIESFYGSKVRDLENKGKIVKYELIEAPDLRDKKVLIIDDICCLGGTAYNAARELKNNGAKEVAFYISHCENGIYFGNILKTEKDTGKYLIDKVYTANTMNIKVEHSNLKLV